MYKVYWEIDKGSYKNSFMRCYALQDFSVIKIIQSEEIQKDNIIL